MSKLQLLLTLLSLCAGVLSAAPPNATVVHQFPNGTALENLAIRSNGGILTSSLYTREILYVDPSNPTEVSTIATFPNGTSVTGITEHGVDIFYFCSSGFTNSNPGSPDSNNTEKVWRLDLRNYQGNQTLPFELIANVTDGGFLDGLTSIDGSDYILAADGQKTSIWRINVMTGQYDVSLNSSVLLPIGSGAVIPKSKVGANGLNYRAPYVYFSNTLQSLYGRFSVGPTGQANGTIEILGQNIVVDDLAPTKGNGLGAYLTAPNVNQILLGTGDVDGKLVPIASVGGPTSIRWGRTPMDQKTLYISSTGNNTAYVGLSDPAAVLTVGGAISKIVVGGPD